MRGLVALFLCANALGAAEYYVSPSGSDRATGTEAAPFQSIERGLAAAQSPGDEVILRGGEYRPVRTINIVNPGAKERPIVLRAHEGEVPIIDGRDQPEDANVIHVATHFIRIKGLTVRNGEGTGISVWGPGSRVRDVQIVGNVVHHCRRGGIHGGNASLADPVRNLLFENNTVYDNVQRNRGGTGDSWDCGLGAGLSKGVTIRNNVVRRNYGEGIGLYLSTDGVIEGNTVRDNFSVNIYLDNATAMRVSGNFAFSSGDTAFYRQGHPAGGIQVANEGYNGFVNHSAHLVIINNILVGNRSAVYFAGYQRGGGLRHVLVANNTCHGSTGALLDIDASEDHLDARIVNNLFVQNDRAPLTDIGGDVSRIEFGHNLWSGGNPQDAAVGDGDVLAGPRWEDPESGDPKGFQLQADSPARDRGVVLDSVPQDFGGNLREDQNDLGAWQAKLPPKARP